MSYFKDFQYLSYDFTIKTDRLPKVEVIVDLMQRVDFSISDASLEKMCDHYVVQGATKPEQIANNIYGDPLLHWTILYVNGITDIHSEWVISDIALSEFVTKKYGAGKENMIHHYEKMPEGIVIDQAFCLTTYGEEPREVTNADYESELNDAKRFIRVIKPEYIARFVSAFKEALVNG